MLRPALRRVLALAFPCLGFAVVCSGQHPPGTITYVVDSSYAEAPLLAALDDHGGAPLLRAEAAGTLLLRSRELVTRRRAFDSLYAVLPRAAADPVADWDALSSVSRVDEPDGAWRLLTWQLFVDDSTYVCGGLFLPREGAPVPLLDSAQAKGLDREYELLPEQWYGAVYYGVQPFRLRDKREAWLLFGYDADGFAHRRKVADVLTLDRRGRPRFGAEVFVGMEGRPGYTFSRLVLEYRVDARVGLRYDDALGGIVHDRLVAGPPLRRGDPPSGIPDGSYDGYVYDRKDGRWHYREEWFDRVVSEEAPRPAPLFDAGSAETRDLFGRPAKRRVAKAPPR